MVNYKKASLLAVTFLITLSSMAQDTNIQASTNESGFMRSEGKIYVVMVVVITILAGLILYISRLDRKLRRLEKGESS